ncbi:hypothetical protein DMENIID0001_105620 [Sergentomyia squamirostris]
MGTRDEEMIDGGFLPVITKSLKRSHGMISPKAPEILTRNRFVAPGFSDSVEEKKILPTNQPSQFHSFATDEEKFFKVYLSGIVGFSDEEIKSDLLKAGLKVNKVITYSTHRIKTGAFIVLLERGTSTIKELKEKHRYVCHCSVGWAKFIQKRGEIVQCRRCQFGHAAAKCGHIYRCVKCTEDHQPGECPRTTREGTAKCVNCDGPHAANYKGCPTYKNFRQQRLQSIVRQRFRNTQRQPREATSNTVQYIPAPLPQTNAWSLPRNFHHPSTSAATAAPNLHITGSPANPQVPPAGAEEPQFCMDAKILEQDLLFEEALKIASKWVRELRNAATAEDRARILFLHRLTPEAMRRP